jgi:DNA-binding NarL/FixJ family response regulator
MNTQESDLNAGIKVMIADDHPIFRDGLKVLLAKMKPDPVVVLAEAGTGEEVLQLLQKEVPHVILMDIQMPEMNGIQATALIRELYPEIAVLALSSYNDLWSVSDMIEAGAQGYLLKNTSKEELNQALTTIFEGGSFFSPTIASHLNTLLKKDEGVGKFQALSPREKEVVQLICEGKANKEIASHLAISKRTVEGHRDKIMDKINARHPADIVTYAVKKGLFKI